MTPDAFPDAGGPPLPGAAGAVTVAAVDLGSNSFHMVIARWREPDLTVLDRLREPVRLADGLTEDQRLAPEVQERAIACLERFGERVRALPPACVRAVGTNTLRLAKRDPGFRTRARNALGHPIEVISGLEEARLIWQGIARSHPASGRPRLALDIGGGSTEVMVGEELEMRRAHSLYVGCVGASRRHFPDGRIDRARFRAAETEAGLEFRSVRADLLAHGWDEAIGSSGTIRAVSELLGANGLGGPEITLPGLKQLCKRLVQAGSTEALDLEGLKPDRRSVLPGGLAILLAAFKQLGVASMSPSTGALREGVLWDLLGRIGHQDIRDLTIRRFVERYHVDVAQAERVGATALRLLDAVGPGDSLEVDAARALLSWAAWLHEIGLVVSWTGYHKHGAYLVTHSDLPGFSNDDQAMLAALVRGHRRKLDDTVLAEVPAGKRDAVLRLCALLRVAVLLHRSRRVRRISEPDVEWTGSRVVLRFPAGWTSRHPLTVADLEAEARSLGSAGIELELSEAD